MSHETLEHANITVQQIDPALRFLLTALPSWRVRGVRISANVTGDFGNVTDYVVGAGLRGDDCSFGVGLPGSGTS